MKPCSMGVGCDEAGTCFAVSQGQPWQCPHHKASIQCADCEGPSCEVCGGTGERAIGVFDPVCARHCTVCEGQDHHWSYDGDQNQDGEPLMGCRHCPALRPFTDDDDANYDY